MAIATLLPNHADREKHLGIDAAKCCQVTAIAALDMKIDLRMLLRGSGPAIAMLVIETLLLGFLILGWVVFGGQF